jgi:hypothetical protein
VFSAGPRAAAACAGTERASAHRPWKSPVCVCGGEGGACGVPKGRLA